MNFTRALSLAAIAISTSSCVVAPPMSPASVYQRVSASAVIVTTRTGSGSGTVILRGREASLVLTAQHVVEAEGRVVEVLVPYATGERGVSTSRARVLLVDRDRDLALLLSDAPLAAPALPVAAREPDLYEAVYMVAAPMGLAGTAAPGVVSAKLERDGAALWEITGLTFFGSSGGTVANTRGELVAVPVVVSTWNGLPIPQIGFAVPLASIHAFLDRAVSGGAIDL
jgi:S1-C subfamily serine protease